MKVLPSGATQGFTVAAAIVGLWLTSINYALFVAPEPSWPASAQTALLFIWLQFLYVGLFITAHDACHGTLAPGWRRTNRAIGYLCAGFYAGFDFGRLADKHYLHHKHVGTEHDPDFYRDARGKQNFFVWVTSFFIKYLTWQQLIIMTLLSQLLLNWLQVPAANVYVYWVGPSIMSAFQLFFFGTYLPHRVLDAEPFADAHAARNSRFGRLMSLLSCYHFGYHHVHHLMPYLPWYDLPRGLATSAAAQAAVVEGRLARPPKARTPQAFD